MIFFSVLLTGNLSATLFHKSTYTRLLLDFNSFTSRVYNFGLTKCLDDRAYKINNTWIKLNDDHINIKSILKGNSYPTHVTDKVIKKNIEESIFKWNSQIIKEKDIKS